ncbi:MAG: hypothetical protein JWM11_1016 [Planctomycetaceae bacterium]|nr:hypothetical protein [Planctomycetaceae bacterium]
MPDLRIIPCDVRGAIPPRTTLITSDRGHSMTISSPIWCPRLRSALRMLLALLSILCCLPTRAVAFPPDQIRRDQDSDARADEQEQPELKRVQGVWRVVQSQVGDEQAGSVEMARRRVIIKGNKLTYVYGNPQNEKREGTLKLDPHQHSLDLMVPRENATLLALYEIQGDTFRIGFGNDGLIRPKSWKMGPHDVCWLLVLRRDDSEITKNKGQVPVWVADASRSEFPDQPAAGRLHGQDFHVDRASLSAWWEASGNVGDPLEKQDRVDGAVLRLQAGNKQPASDVYTLFLVVKPGAVLANQTFEVPLAGLFKQSQKIMDRGGKGWFYPVAAVQAQSTGPDGKDHVVVAPKVTLRLTVAERQQDRLPGRIYLCLDDAEKSFVAGSFTAFIDENGPALPASASSKPRDEPNDRTSSELNKLEGVWVPTWVESGGEKAAAKQINGIDQPLVIKDGKTKWNYEGKDYDVVITVDPTKSPKTLDRKIVAGTGVLKDFTSRAIYELDGDTLKICFNAEMEETRPDKFRSDGTIVIFTYARKKTK